MMSFFTHRVNRFAAFLSIISFAIGTLIFILYQILQLEALVGLGLFFIVLAVIVNSITLLMLIGNTILHYKDFKEHSIAMVLLLLNIPIALFYFNFIII